MHPIPPHPLWLGHTGDIRDVESIFDAGIRAVVQLAEEERPLVLPRELMDLRFPLIDGEGNPPELLGLAIVTLANLLRLRVPTLACCSLGLSRSPAIAAAALALLLDEPPEAWVRRLQDHHPSDLSPTFWNEVVEHLPTVRATLWRQ